MWIKWTWIVKTGNYQFSKSRGSCKKLKRLNDKTADCKCGLLFPSLGTPFNMAWEIARKCGMHIYSRRTLGLLHGKLLWVFLQKYLSRRYEIFQVGNISWWKRSEVKVRTVWIKSKEIQRTVMANGKHAFTTAKLYPQTVIKKSSFGFSNWWSIHAVKCLWETNWSKK